MLNIQADLLFMIQSLKLCGQTASVPMGHCSQWQQPAGWTGARGAAVLMVSYEGRRMGHCLECENCLSESEGRFLALNQVLFLSRTLVPESV